MYLARVCRVAWLLPGDKLVGPTSPNCSRWSPVSRIVAVAVRLKVCNAPILSVPNATCMHAMSQPTHTVSRATRTPCTLPLPPAAASVVAVATLPPAAAALSLALAASLAASLAAPAAVALRAATVAFGATPPSPSPPRVRAAAAAAALALAAVSCDPPSCRPRRRPLALAPRPRQHPRWSPTPPRRATAVPYLLMVAAQRLVTQISVYHYNRNLRLCELSLF